MRHPFLRARINDILARVEILLGDVEKAVRLAQRLGDRGAEATLERLREALVEAREGLGALLGERHAREHAAAAELLVGAARRALREGRLEDLAVLLVKLLSGLVGRLATAPREADNVLAEMEELLWRIGIKPEYVVVRGEAARRLVGEEAAILIPIGEGGVKRPEENRAFILVTPRGGSVVHPREASRVIEAALAGTRQPRTPGQPRLHARA